jgi:hypothetical protein
MGWEGGGNLTYASVHPTTRREPDKNSNYHSHRAKRADPRAKLKYGGFDITSGGGLEAFKKIKWIVEESFITE